MALSITQWKAIKLLTDLEAKHTHKAVCKLVGIAESTLWRWFRQNGGDNEFMEQYNQQLTMKKYAKRDYAWKALMSGIERGDTKLIEDYFKMIGELVPAELRTNVNLSLPRKTKGLEGMTPKALRDYLVSILKSTGMSGKQFDEIAGDIELGALGSEIEAEDLVSAGEVKAIDKAPH